MPDDVIAAMDAEHRNYFYGDVHVRGKYPGYMKRYFREHGIQIQFAPEDEEILKNTVDFVSFSYYMSVCATSDPEKQKKVLEIFWEEYRIQHSKQVTGGGRSIRKDCAMC